MEKKMKVSSTLLSVLCVLLGIILVAFPDTTIRTICYIFASCLLAVGLFYVIAYFRKDLMEAYCHRYLYHIKSRYGYHDDTDVNGYCSICKWYC